MKIGIALGSNVGDRAKNMEAGFALLQKLAMNGKVLRSSMMETEPIDCPPGSESFLNAAAEIDYDRTPQQLHQELRKLESELGRAEERPRNAPRPLDLDILYFGDFVVNEEDLTIPHPRMMEREFVLKPLSEIRPDLVLPGEKETVRELLKKISL